MTEIKNVEQESPKIDRWNSVPLDVHKWSDHPEIKELTDKLYADAGINQLDKSGNRKAKRSAKEMLRVLLVDLYVNWLHDPTRAIGFSKNKTSYVVGGRYNKVYISEKIIEVEAALHGAGWLDELQGYYDRSGRSESYSTRIRPSTKLRNEFSLITASLYDIDFNVQREVIILRKKFEDEERKIHKVNVNYDDTEYTKQIRLQLVAYNQLLGRTFIDIPSLTEPFVRRSIERGQQQGQALRISIGPDNKHVHRVFNGSPEDNWSKGG